MGYDFERLGVACEQLLECVDAVLRHKAGYKFTWRLEHLKREVFSFKATAFPNGTGGERKRGDEGDGP